MTVTVMGGDDIYRSNRSSTAVNTLERCTGPFRFTRQDSKNRQLRHKQYLC